MTLSLFRHRPSGPGWKCETRGHILETQHLILRPPRSNDFEALRATFDGEVIYRQGWLANDSELDKIAKAAIHRVHRRPYSETWVICDRSSGKVIGMRGVTANSDDAEKCETGSSLADGWRGRGFGKEELAAFIGLLSHLGFRTAEASSSLDNERAIALYTKLGFKRTRTAQHKMPNGYVTTCVWMTLDVSAPKLRCPLFD